MLVAQIISVALFVISLLMIAIVIIASLFKNVGISRLGILSWIAYFLIPFLPFVLEQMLFQTAPEIFGAAYIFIFMNVLGLTIPYFLLVGTTIFGKQHIYRITCFFTLKKYAYEDVIRYRMKYESGVMHTRLGQRKVIDYVFEIYFSDCHYSEFSVDKHNDKRIACIKKILEDHRCRQNKRIDESKYHL